MLLPLHDDNHIDTIPFVTYGVIAVNVGVLLAVLTLHSEPEAFIAYYGLIPAGSHPTRLITHMFMHADPVHLLGNMLFLWVFGGSVEDRFGSLRFAVFYLAGGIIASLVYVLFNLGSESSLVGASGAIAAVLGAYFVLLPDGRVRFLWLFIIPSVRTVWMSARWMIGAWFLLDLWATDFSGSLLKGGVAYLAHVAGYLAGLGGAMLAMHAEWARPRTRDERIQEFYDKAARAQEERKQDRQLRESAEAVPSHGLGAAAEQLSPSEGAHVIHARPRPAGQTEGEGESEELRWTATGGPTRRPPTRSDLRSEDAHAQVFLRRWCR